MENDSLIPKQERERLLSVLAYDVLDSAKDEQLDALTHLIANIFQVPIALITILDENRQWFKSNYGLTIAETARSISFCQYTIMEDSVFEVNDAALSKIFKDNPLVTDHPHIRYYCGAPLKNEQGFIMGSLALIDNVPRQLENSEKKTLQLLARTVVDHFELNLKRRELQQQKELLEHLVDERTGELRRAVDELRKRDEKIVSINNELSQLIYKASHDLLGPIKTIEGLISLGLQEKGAENLYRVLHLISSTTGKLDQALVNLIRVVTIKECCEPRPVVWEVLINHAEGSARKRVKGKSLFVNKEITLLNSFSSDNALLKMVLEELFVNSMQYNLNSEVKIELLVRESKDGQRAELLIEDNGIGIRKDEKEHIFEMFYKNARSQGSGLGLYIVQKAVEKLEGQIVVESGLNAGTSVLIQLPSLGQNKRQARS